MFGISWYEFLIIIIVSFICLKPSDFRKIIITIRDIINFINSLIAETKEKIEKSLTLDELKIEDFYIIDKKEIIEEEPLQNANIKKRVIKKESLKSRSKEKNIIKKTQRNINTKKKSNKRTIIKH